MLFKRGNLVLGECVRAKYLRGGEGGGYFRKVYSHRSLSAGSGGGGGGGGGGGCERKVCMLADCRLLRVKSLQGQKEGV